MYPCKRTTNGTNTIFNKKHATVTFNNMLYFRKNPGICTNDNAGVDGQIDEHTYVT